MNEAEVRVSGMTEDEVRDILRERMGLYDSKYALSGVGQQTSLKQLGFDDGTINSLRPDGWYLPKNIDDVAIVCEVKNSKESIDNNIEQLLKYVKAVNTKYKKAVGVIYNGSDVSVFLNDKRFDIKNQLFKKEYYTKLFNKDTIDKNLIYDLTRKINNNLHFSFGVKNLNHRMVFTACSLVARRYGAVIEKGMDWATLHQSILSTLKKSYEKALQQNQKLNIISEQYALIQCNLVENQDAIDDFIDCIDKISENINSDFWQGEDVMSIFFNEFTRYKGKNEQGQVFTPDHITSLIYRITETSHKDRVLDACCGSGAFLTKAMSNMIKEVGGVNNDNMVIDIKSNRLFGVEFDKEIYTLACANMLIHKDGKANFIQSDSRTKEIGDWIKQQNISRVLMNPPFETKYGCDIIVKNVLDNVSDGAICAFILPNQRLVTSEGFYKKIFNNHRLMKIIKLPDIFVGSASANTSIFIFKAGEPQSNRDIFTCWIQEDGLETVKNQGRHDINNQWHDIENYWTDVIYKQSGDDSVAWIKPDQPLCYKIPEKDLVITYEDLKEIVFDYVLYENKIDKKKFDNLVLDYVLWGRKHEILNDNVIDFIKRTKETQKIDTKKWKTVPLINIFDVSGSQTTKKKILDESGEGIYPYVTTSAKNNGVNSYHPIFTEKGGCITVDSACIGVSFYQEIDFSASDHVEVLRPKNKMSKEVSLFMVFLLNAIGKQREYSYTYKRSQRELRKESILMPFKVNGDVDWEYIYDFSKNIYDDIRNIFKL